MKQTVEHSSELNFLPATKLSSLIRDKKISCVELMKAYLQQIATVNPEINAIVEQLSEDKALALAKRADDAIAKNKAIGPLHGIPITHKNGYKAKGFYISKGNNSPLNGVATENNTVLQRLLDAGAILIGITNTPEYLMGFDSNNLLYGRTLNPYDKTRIPGGSSGGQAASIAAGCSVLGMGTDGGGSIRQPAHNCGIAALKPTQGLLSYAGGWPTDAVGVMRDYVVAGPMARSVDDLLLMLQITAGPDGIDPSVAPVPLGDVNKVDLSQLRIAYFTDNGCAKTDKATGDTIANVVAALKSQCKYIKEDCPSAIKYYMEMLPEVLFYGCDGGQWALNMKAKMEVTGPNSPEFAELLERAKKTNLTTTEFRERFYAVDEFRYQMMAFMQDYDVMITPVATAPAKPLDKVYAFSGGEDLTFNVPVNVAGMPSAVVRCGTSPEGLPIGVQIIAAPWADHITLAVAKWLEKQFTGFQAPMR